jgi:hypothetical protein
VAVMPQPCRYWHRNNGYLPKVWTAQGAATLSVAEAAKAGALACPVHPGKGSISHCFKFPFPPPPPPLSVM